jgi:uncharacterized protein YdeI (YjbR/CyaY-like superfamily)
VPITAPQRGDVRIFPRQADFRAWLLENHASTPALFIGFYKKGVPKTAMTYAEAVEEALCFGWIDGITYRIDDEVTASRFSPRRAKSNWSAVNTRRVEELRAQGRMHPAGIAAFEARQPHQTGVYSYENRPYDLPDPYLQRVRANADAWRFWQAQRPGYRRGATWWVISAKREATRDRRLETLIEDSAAQRWIKPLLIGRDHPQERANG